MVPMAWPSRKKGWSESFAYAVLLVSMLVRSARAIMCVVCEDAGPGRGLGDCETTPPAPKNCTVCLTIVDNDCVLYANFDHCLVVRKYSHNGTLLTFSRSCSPAYFKPVCISGNDQRDNVAVKVCHETCDTNGCNRAPQTSGAPTLWLYVATIGGLLTQWLPRVT